MKVQRGDIVLVEFPFGSGVGLKLRPALVVQNDNDNRRITHTIVAMITSRTDRARREPTQLLIEVLSPAGIPVGSVARFGDQLQQSVHG
jgi:mRNA interferase MazF